MKPCLHHLPLCLAALTLFSCASRPVRTLDTECRRLFPEGGPGAEVLIMKGDKVLFNKGYGLRVLPVSANADTTRLAISDGTMFNIASCSKQFTAVAVLQLAERGLLDLDAPVNTYLPELTAPLWDSVTVAHMLSHSSGIPDARGYLSREERVRGTDSLAVAYMSCDVPFTLHFTPGTDYEYINPTFTLMGFLIERLTGEPFEDYMHNHLFLPAGMNRTLYFTPDKNIPLMAHAYEYGSLDGMGEEHHSIVLPSTAKTRQKDGKRTATTANVNDEMTGTETDSSTDHDWYEYDYGEETFFATRPDGGIYTSASELVLWEKALRRALSANAPRPAGTSGTLLGADLLRSAMSPHTTVSGSRWSDYQNRPGTYYGYGWFIEPDKGCIYHTGDNGGFKALMARYPKQELFVVILANRTDWDRYALKTLIEQLFL